MGTWIAAQNGHTATVRALVQECGADAGAADKDGASPTWIAAFNGRTETVRALVQECGADAGAADKNGVSPTLIALAKHTCFRQEDVVDYLNNLRARFSRIYIYIALFNLSFALTYSLFLHASAGGFQFCVRILQAFPKHFCGRRCRKQ